MLDSEGRLREDGSAHEQWRRRKAGLHTGTGGKEGCDERSMAREVRGEEEGEGEREGALGCEAEETRGSSEEEGGLESDLTDEERGLLTAGRGEAGGKAK